MATILPPETFEVVRLGRAFPVLRQPRRGARQLVADGSGVTRPPVREATFRRRSRPQPDRPVPSNRGRSPFARAGDGGDVAQRRSGPVSTPPHVPRPARRVSAASRRLRHGVRHRSSTRSAPSSRASGSSRSRTGSTRRSSRRTPSRCRSSAGRREHALRRPVRSRNGVGHAIAAFTILKRTRADLRLVVVGDGPLRPLVERLVPDALRGTSSSRVASTGSGRAIWRARMSSAHPAPSPRSGWSCSRG